MPPTPLSTQSSQGLRLLLGSQWGQGGTGGCPQESTASGGSQVGKPDTGRQAGCAVGSGVGRGRPACAGARPASGPHSCLGRGRGPSRRGPGCHASVQRPLRRAHPPQGRSKASSGRRPAPERARAHAHARTRDQTRRGLGRASSRPGSGSRLLLTPGEGSRAGASVGWGPERRGSFPTPPPPGATAVDSTERP